MPELHVVTGAYGFSGKYIASRLLEHGHRVRTLTNSTARRNPFGARVEAHPLAFSRPEELARSLRGAEVLYNTYWIRFEARGFRHDTAVENSIKLFQAARSAGVRRVVHVSITNPSEASDLPYFRGKALLERVLRESGLSHAILRPAVLFGAEDILVNNIAWALRRLPLFGLFGDGRYGLQPIHVDDLARLAVEQGSATENITIDAIGPETLSYRELAETIGAAIGKQRPMVPVPPWLGWLAALLLGLVVGDVMLTRQEIEGLMRGLLTTQSPPAGQTRLSAWCREHADSLGRRYANELARRRDRETPYREL